MKKYIDILPEKLVFQGNLDPVRLLVGGVNERRAFHHERYEGKRFYFNLGRGLPKTAKM